MLSQSLWMSRGALPPWRLPPVRWPSSAFQVLIVMSRRVLWGRRPTRRRHLLRLRRCPRLAWGVQLLWAAGPKGLPRQHPPGVPVIGGVLADAEPLLRLGGTLLVGGGRWFLSAALLLTRPLTTGWAWCCTVYWGVSLPWPSEKRWVTICCVTAVRGLRPPATFVVVRSWAASMVRSPLKGGGHSPLVRCEGVYPPSSGGFTVN